MYSFPTNQDHLSLLTVCFLISLQCNSILLTLCPLHNSFIYPNVSLYIYYMQLKFHACFASQHVRSDYLHKAPEEWQWCAQTPRYPWTYLARAAQLRSAGSCSYVLQLLTCIGTHGTSRGLKACVKEPAEAAVTLWQPSYTSAFPTATVCFNVRVSSGDIKRGQLPCTSLQEQKQHTEDSVLPKLELKSLENRAWMSDQLQ